MDFADLLHKFLQILHLIGENNPGTNITTYEPFNTTYTPVIYDATTLKGISDSDRTKFASTFDPSSFSYESTERNDRKTSIVTGITAESEGPIAPNKTTTTELPSGNTTTSQATTTKIPSGNTTTSQSTTTKIPSGNTTTSQTVSTVTETTVSNKTDEPKNTTTSGTQSTITVSVSTVNGTTVTSSTVNETTVTDSTVNDTTVTSSTVNETTITGSTVNGTTVTASSGTSSDTDTTTIAPTAEPKRLSRGAVAGIVIGCLLLIAVVAAAIVFFVKNRNIPPEAQRLRV